MSHSRLRDLWKPYEKYNYFLVLLEPIEENPKSKNKNTNQNFSRKADVVATFSFRSRRHFGSRFVFCVRRFHLIRFPLFCVFGATESETIIFHFWSEKAPVKSRSAQSATV